MHKLESMYNPHGIDLLLIIFEGEEKPESDIVKLVLGCHFFINSPAPKRFIIVNELEFKEGNVDEGPRFALQKHLPELIGSENHLIILTNTN